MYRLTHTYKIIIIEIAEVTEQSSLTLRLTMIILKLFDRGKTIQVHKPLA